MVSQAIVRFPNWSCPTSNYNRMLSLLKLFQINGVMTWFVPMVSQSSAGPLMLCGASEPRISGHSSVTSKAQASGC